MQAWTASGNPKIYPVRTAAGNQNLVSISLDFVTNLHGGKPQ